MSIRRTRPKAADTGDIHTKWIGSDIGAQLFSMGMCAGGSRARSIELMREARRHQWTPPLCALLVSMARTYRRSYRASVKQAREFDAMVMRAAALNASVAATDRAKSH